MADNNNSKVQRAKVAQVEFGAVTLEGLMLPDGSFAIAGQQVCEVFQLDKTNVLKTLKSLLGKDVQLVKTATDRASRQNRAENCITLLQLEKLIIRLALKGNLIAGEILEASIGMTLTQRFSDAFGVKLDRAEYLRNRILNQKRKKVHPLFGDENMNKVANF
jgi:hypothetical protein